MPKHTTRKNRSKPKPKTVKSPRPPAKVKDNKTIKPISQTKLANVIQLSRGTVNVIWQNRKFFIGLTIIYGLLNLILVQGLASTTDITSIKSELNKIFNGNITSLVSSLSIYAVLLGSSGNSSNPTAGAYQLFLALIASLAIIWSLRQILSNKKIRIRDAYYKGMTPLIPFILIIIFLCIELLPMLIGIIIYISANNGVAVGLFENLIFLAILIIGVALSMYLIVVPIIALYIVTLDNMMPRQALKAAKELVKGRRLRVLRKILYLPLAIAVVTAIIMVPIILWLTGITQWVFFLLTMFSLVAIHTYMFTLYRDLLNE